jgi:hypothetical protein
VALILSVLFLINELFERGRIQYIFIGSMAMFVIPIRWLWLISSRKSNENIGIRADTLPKRIILGALVIGVWLPFRSFEDVLFLNPVIVALSASVLAARTNDSELKRNCDSSLSSNTK